MNLFLYTDLIHDFFILLHRLIITKTITNVKRKSDFSSKFREFNRKIRKISLTMGLLSDSLTVLATQLVFFIIGWIFFVKKLFKDYELRHYMVQLIFCINFTLSCTMFELIIFEIADTLERSSRYFHWYLSLYLTLFMVIIMTPLYLSYYLLANTRNLFAQKYLWPLAGKKYI